MSKKNKKQKNNEVIVDRSDMEIDSFTSYKHSDDGKTKIVDGEKVIESFHMYSEEKKED